MRAYQVIRDKQTITLCGKTYTREEVLSDQVLAPDAHIDFYRSLVDFLKEWWNDSPTLTVQTSGSTGKPKQMQVEKERMMASAQLTCSFLNLHPGDSALLCMSLDYIAGKMMVVRALVAGLDLHLITPSGHPLQGLDQPFTFAAMVPLQVVNSLSVPSEARCFKQIEQIIIGGSAIDRQLEDRLKHLPNAIYSSYGMTETLSHIALRRMSGVEASRSYIPFEQVTVSLSEEGTLVIDAPLVSPIRLVTNDIAEIAKDGSFRILGRRDHVIISGGLKIQIEEVEQLLSPLMEGAFAVTSMPDEKFGEALVLVTTSPINEEALAHALPPYYLPKKYIQRKTLPLLPNGKLDRLALKQLAKEN